MLVGAASEVAQRFSHRLLDQCDRWTCLPLVDRAAGDARHVRVSTANAVDSYLYPACIHISKIDVRLPWKV